VSATRRMFSCLVGSADMLIARYRFIEANLTWLRAGRSPLSLQAELWCNASR
jgi:hypothetical protein